MLSFFFASGLFNTLQWFVVILHTLTKQIYILHTLRQKCGVCVHNQRNFSCFAFGVSLSCFFLVVKWLWMVKQYIKNSMYFVPKENATFDYSYWKTRALFDNICPMRATVCVSLRPTAHSQGAWQNLERHQIKYLSLWKVSLILQKSF